jgi:superfamily II DNA/RNA helicase
MVLSNTYVELEREEWKLPVLLDLYQQIAVNQALIYVNKRQKAEWLAKQLAAQGFTLEYIHGEMEVGERKKRMEDFRSGQCVFLSVLIFWLVVLMFNKYRL